jgi:hypothetical protein
MLRRLDVILLLLRVGYSCFFPDSLDAFHYKFAPKLPESVHQSQWPEVFHSTDSRSAIHLFWYRLLPL